jgi:hypothetical protein
MKKINLLSLVYSIIVAVLFIVLVKSDVLQKIPGFQCDGFGCMGLGIIYTVTSLVVIPLIFAIAGFVAAKENRWAQAFSSLGISLVVMILTFMVTGIYK